MYSLLVLFDPGISNGNLIWLAILSLVIYIHNNSKVNLLIFITVNLFTFLNLYLFFGTAGNQPVRGLFFESTYFIYAVLFIYFISRLISFNGIVFFKIGKITEDKFILKLKYIIIAVVVLFNISLIPADGTSDHVSWTQYAKAGVEYPNPFLAYTKVDNPYPPLSSVIISIYANLWK